MHPAPCTLHPAPCTLHPAPCTLHPAPCTLHPARHVFPPSRARVWEVARDFGVGGRSSPPRVGVPLMESEFPSYAHLGHVTAARCSQEPTDRCTLTPAPCTLHPAPCTLHPAPCTLHPEAHTSLAFLLLLVLTMPVSAISLAQNLRGPLDGRAWESRVQGSRP
jgi:hypothetical protein